jgi:proteasome lid subunit RPN8/RPN11
MRTVRLPLALSDRLQDAARAGYPEEACGFLFSDAADADGPARLVRSAEPAPNVSDGERRRRFVIAPDELRAAEARGALRGEVVSGFYHSHPDHPAEPSAFDTEHAWPWYTYLIVSVDATGGTSVAAFELEADGRRFVPCPLGTATPADGAAAGASVTAPVA